MDPTSNPRELNSIIPLAGDPLAPVDPGVLQDRRAGRIIRLAGVFYGALAGAGFGWMAWMGGSLGAARHAVVGPHAVEATAMGAVIGAVIVLLSEMLSRIWSVARGIEAEFRTILGPLSPVDCVLLALLSAIGEELFFRGGLQGFLGTWIPKGAGQPMLSPVAALTVTALIFGGAHIPMKAIFGWWTAFAIAMGFLLGWLAQIERGLLGPIAVHAVVNAGNLWRMTRRGRS